MDKKLLFLFLALFFVLVIALAAFFTLKNVSGTSLGGKTATNAKCSHIIGEVRVLRDEQGFSPRESSIKVCTRVIFKNNLPQAFWPASDIHPTHGIYPEFDPLQGINPGGSWFFVFDRVGRWRYHDHLSPQVTGIMNVIQ